MFDDELRDAAARLISNATAKGIKITTAESCTGGLLAALLTSVPGSSNAYDCGFVTYSNIAKQNLLGISWDMLETHGAVSPQVANAMAAGALKASVAQVAVSITGIAGPSGGTPNKPVGLVYFGLAKSGSLTRNFEHNFPNLSREQVRTMSVQVALSLLDRAINS